MHRPRWASVGQGHVPNINHGCHAAKVPAKQAARVGAACIDSIRDCFLGKGADHAQNGHSALMAATKPPRVSDHAHRADQTSLAGPATALCLDPGKSAASSASER